MTRVQLAVGALLLVLTLAVRLPAVDDPLSQDEIGAERVISKPSIRGAVEQVVGHESTPPAFYVAARVADRAAGSFAAENRALVGRFLSIVFSLGCTLLTFVLARQLLSLWAAAAAGFVVSISSVLVVHGSELRAYSLLALGCVAFALLLERAAERPSQRRLLALAAVAALGSLTHYFFLFTLAAGLIWLLLSGRSRSVVRRRVGSALAVGLIPLAVWAPFWFLQYRHGLFATAPPFSLSRFLELVPSLFAPQALVIEMSAAVLAAINLVVLVPAALLARRPEGRLCALFLLAPLFLVSALAWLTGERIFNTRNLIGIAPFAAVAIASGCASLPWRKVSYAAGALVCALVTAGFAYAETHLGRTPYDRIADELHAQGLARDEPIVWFGNRGGISPVGWYLTPDAPADTWPRLAHAESTDGTCSALQVVVRTETGRKWLARHQNEVLAETSLPSFGDVPLGGRRPDLTVARVRWSPRILERPAGAANWYLLRLADTRSPCLRP